MQKGVKKDEKVDLTRSIDIGIIPMLAIPYRKTHTHV